ncbi:substrate-binding domain-containing protein [Dactylosporangium salmoneum]|uniref:Substrate-binding domain-containing protein n=1 Tax=Dactylosporangium salmoneum TaxID=53361 RepID=A0ABN3H6I8_9ACTN
MIRQTSAPRRVLIAALGLSLAATFASACSSPKEAAQEPAGDGAPIKVGLVYSQTGPLASYGKQYIEGWKAGLAYATKGTGKVGNRPIEVKEVDDAGDAAKAVSAGKDLIGQGYKIIAGSTSSGVAGQMAPLAAQNKVLFISGPAATDAITGINKYTFRSGRQSYQDVLAAKSYLASPTGKKVLVFTQDGAFGKSNADAVKAVVGGAGATVENLFVPANATDFTGFAVQAKNAKADMIFVAWAGATASAMWQALDQQGVLGSTLVVTGIDQRASWPTFGAAGSKISLLAHYFDGASDNEAVAALRKGVEGGKVDLFHPDGFTAAQMVVRAATEGGDDVDKMVTALEGYSFDGVKGKLTIRKEDHALLQPMFQGKFSGTGADLKPELVKALDPADASPPVAQMKG